MQLRRSADGVSCETARRCEIFADLLRKWNPRINLVSPSTLPDLEHRHISDSLQIATLAPNATKWLDLGSGGGLPGLIVAAAKCDEDISFTLIESDQRKCAFMREASRLMGLQVEVCNQRIEASPVRRFDTISARALAPLPRLLDLAEPWSLPKARMIFMKGVKVDEEIAESNKYWRFSLKRVPSRTNPDGVILVIEDLVRV